MGNNCCKKKNEVQFTLNTEDESNIKFDLQNLDKFKGIEQEFTTMDNTKNSLLSLGYKALNDYSLTVNNFKNDFKVREEKEINKFIDEILIEFNKIRTDPAGYSEVLNTHLQYIYLKPDANNKNVISYYENSNYWIVYFFIYYK